MDITGRAAGFRGIAVRCPGCAETMSRESTGGDNEIDVCGACGGVWVDWFDGEVRQVASEIVTQGIVGRSSAPDAIRNEARAIGACPRCAKQLVDERYRIEKKGSSSLTTDASLMRCEDCAGVFVSRFAAETLASLPADEPPPPSESAGKKPPPEGSWRAMLTKLRGLL
jgi:Zn-finger nucleic acid-binding protein